MLRFLSRALGLAAASAALLGAAGAARADDTFDEEDGPLHGLDRRAFGLFNGFMHLDYLRVREPERLSGLSDLAMAGLSFRVLYGKRIAYAAGLDLALGGGGAAGLGLDATLYPAGVAVALGPTGYFGVRLGVGAQGVTERVPVTVVLPVEARLELDMWRRVRLGFCGGVAWTPAEGARQGGSAMVPFADESWTAITARFGRTFPSWRASNAGRGLFLRLSRHEQMRTALFGVSIGYEVDMAQ